MAQERKNTNQEQLLDILTHNVFLFTRTVLPNWGQDIRANNIMNSDYIKGHDVVVLNETFDNKARGTLLNGLKNQYPYQTPVVGGSKDGWRWTKGNF